MPAETSHPCITAPCTACAQEKSHRNSGRVCVHNASGLVATFWLRRCARVSVWGLLVCWRGAACYRNGPSHVAADGALVSAPALWSSISGQFLAQQPLLWAYAT